MIARVAMAGLGVLGGLVAWGGWRWGARKMEDRMNQANDGATKLGEFFTLAELTRSSAAADAGLRNEPNAEELAALRELVANVLDPLRRRLRKPVKINSGFRSKAVNDELRRRGRNASQTSQHMLGEAADIVVAGLSARELAGEIVRGGIPFDQVIWYDGGWVHVSFTKRRDNRREVLHSPASGGYFPTTV